MRNVETETCSTVSITGVDINCAGFEKQLDDICKAKIGCSAHLGNSGHSELDT